MSGVSSSFGSGTVVSGTGQVSDKYNELQAEDFLKLIVAELQNQDPMNPMDNTQMVTQISQIRQITSNDSLTKTLEGVSAGQTVATASNLIGKTVSGTSEDGAEVTGIVDRIVFENGEPTLYIGTRVVKPANVTEIKTTESTDSGASNATDE